MALVACKECKAQVSSWASKCPHCGISNPSMTKKRLAITWLILAVMCWFVIKSCLSTTNAPAVESTAVAPAPVSDAAPSYTIISSENRGPLKRSYEVSIPERYSEAQLTAIANKIHVSESPKAERTFIGYRLNGDMDLPYFATTNFTPELEVRVMGMTNTDIDNLHSKLGEFKSYEHAWIIEHGFDHLLVLAKESGKYYFYQLHTDGSRGKYEYNVEVLGDGGLKLMDPEEEYGSHQIVEKDGVIKFIGEAGNVYYEKAAINN